MLRTRVPEAEETTRRGQDLAALQVETRSMKGSSMRRNPRKIRRRTPRLTGLSRQRKSANERERNRVHQVNLAFETLRQIVPLLPSERPPSKVEIVRLASLYIRQLTEMLLDAKPRERAIVDPRESPEACDNEPAYQWFALLCIDDSCS